MWGNVVRGSRNKAHGAQFEAALDGVFRRLAEMGVASIHKTPEPLRVVGRSGRSGVFTAVFAAKAQPDYLGTLRAGRSVMLEAKFSEGDRVAQGRVLPAQAALLDEHAGLGAACGILVCFGFAHFGLAPWGDWRRLKELAGHKYVCAADMERFGWTIGADWAGGLAEKLKQLG